LYIACAYAQLPIQPKFNSHFRSQALSNPLTFLVPARQSFTSPKMAVKTAGGNSAFHNTVNDFAHIEDPNERTQHHYIDIGVYTDNQ
jgi:hypothetical protein